MEGKTYRKTDKQRNQDEKEPTRYEMRDVKCGSVGERGMRWSQD